jgi:PAS domain S-box-containing protein
MNGQNKTKAQLLIENDELRSRLEKAEKSLRAIYCGKTLIPGMRDEQELQLNETQSIAHIGSWHWDLKTDTTIATDELLRIYGLDPARQNMPSFKEQKGLCFSERKLVEDALIGSQQKIKEIPESIKDGFMELDFNWCFTYLNQRAAQNIGQEVDHLIGKNIWETFPTLMGTDQEVLFRQVMEQRHPHQYEVEGTLTQQWYEIHAYPSSEGITIFWSDITERKRIEAAHSQTEKKFHLLFETMTQGVVYHDAEGKITAANPASERILGLTLDQMQGRTPIDPFWKMIHEDGTDFPGDEHPAVVANQTGKIVQNVIMGTHHKTTGELSWIKVDAIPQFKPGEKRPYQVYAMFEDITKRKRVEDALRESEERYRLLYENSPYGIMMTCPDGSILAANAAACQMFGRSEEEICRIGREGLVDIKDPRVLIAIKERRRTGRFYTEMTLIRKDGRHFPAEVSSIMFKDKDGNVKTSMIVRDISERRHAENALKESEMRYRALFEGMTEGFAVHEIILDENGTPCDYRFLDINPSFERMTGLKRANVVGQLKKQVLPNDDPAWVEIYGKVALTGKPVHFENHSSGLNRDYEVYAYRPAPLQFAVLFMDITERKHAEKQAEEGKRILDALMKYVPEGITIAEGEDVTISMASQFGEDLMGGTYKQKTAEEVTRTWQVYDEDGITRLPNEKLPLIRAIQHGEVITNQDLVQINSQGKHLYLSCNAGPIRDHSGKITGAVVAWRDISERKQMEENLRKSEERFRTSIENLMDAFGIYSAIRDKAGDIVDFRIDYVNKAACITYRMTLDQQIGKHLLEVMPALHHHTLFEIYRRVVENGEPTALNGIIYPITDGANTTYPAFDVQVAKLGDGVIAAWRDVTTKIKTEEAIQNLNRNLTQQAEQLRFANTELESFSYSVSHDLRAPLRGIESFTQILLKEHGPQLSPDAQHCLEIIDYSTQKMGTLIEDLLAFSRLSRQELNRRAVALGEIARAAYDELAPEQQGRKVEIEIRKLPVYQVDPALMKQVFINLLSNALKFTRSREKAVVQIGWRKLDGELVFYVKDNGVGFDMRYIGKLFSVFQRLHSDEEYEGTGVGLAIVQRIILRHGGRVWAESQEGKGAVFYFTLNGDQKS